MFLFLKFEGRPDPPTPPTYVYTEASGKRHFRYVLVDLAMAPMRIGGTAIIKHPKAAM